MLRCSLGTLRCALCVSTWKTSVTFSVCMYVCMYACMYVCMYVCTHIYAYMCVYVFVYVAVCAYGSLYICTHACMNAYLHIYIYMNTCSLSTFMHTRISTNTYTHACRHTYTHTEAPRPHEHVLSKCTISTGKSGHWQSEWGVFSGGGANTGWKFRRASSTISILSHIDVCWSLSSRLTSPSLRNCVAANPPRQTWTPGTLNRMIYSVSNTCAYAAFSVLIECHDAKN